MHKLGFITFTAIVLLALTGCSANSEAPAANAGASAAAEPTTATTESSKPLTAGTPSPDAGFLAFVRGDLLPTSQIVDATDEELIKAGHEACDQVRAGTATGDVRLIEGEEPQNGRYADSSSIVTGAVMSYCPDLIESEG